MLLLNALLLFIVLLLAAGLLHDNAITRERVDSMAASIAEMQAAQEKQAAANRQVKADADILLRLVAGGEFVEVEK
jgi:hypothetical protein